MWKLASKSIKESFKSKEEVGRKRTKEEKLECPICWEPFNIVENVPYVLWCGHTICKYCLLGLQRAVKINSLALPFQLPFFITCPWCSVLSLRLVYNGTIKFPSKNYYLLWMVDSMNGDKKVTTGCGEMRSRGGEVSNMASDDGRLVENCGGIRGYFRTGRLHDSVCKSMALVAHLVAKFPLVVIFLVVALYAIPVSAAVLGFYFLITFGLAVPSFLVLYFALPSLNWLIREIVA